MVGNFFDFVHYFLLLSLFLLLFYITSYWKFIKRMIACGIAFYIAFYEKLRAEIIIERYILKTDRPNNLHIK